MKTKHNESMGIKETKDKDTQINIDIAAIDLSKKYYSAIRLKNTHVLHFNSALAWGGAERQLVNTLIGLKNVGMKVALVCEALDYVPDSRFFEEKLLDNEIPFSNMRSDLKQEGLGIQPQYFDHIMGVISKLPDQLGADIIPYIFEILMRKPTVVHAWQDQTCVKVGLAALVCGVPRIYLGTRNINPTHFGYYLYYMKDVYVFLSQFNNVTLTNNSYAGAKSYEEWLGLPENDVVVNYNGFNTEELNIYSKNSTTDFKSKYKIPKGCKIVGSIFRFYEEKDPFLWLNTAEKVLIFEKNVVFVIAGTGPLISDFKNEVVKRGLQKSIFTLGAIKDIQSLFGIMDVFLLCSKFEGLPNVLIEAQVNGVPVVSSTAGGSAETFIDNQSGYDVVVRDPEIIASRVIDLLVNKAKCESFSKVARDFSKSRFSLERMINQTLSEYGLY